MSRDKYMVIKEHQASFSYAMIVRKGDEVIVGKEDLDMSGWFWCKNAEGVDAWVPSTHIDIENNLGVFNQDYNSTELDVQPGETVQFLGESLGWIECLNHEGKYGWIPQDKLKKI